MQFIDSWVHLNLHRESSLIKEDPTMFILVNLDKLRRRSKIIKVSLFISFWQNFTFSLEAMCKLHKKIKLRFLF